MSVVIAIKDGNRILVGADKQGISGDIKTNNVVKIGLVKGIANAIIGSVGYARDGQILRYSDNLIDELTLLKNELNMDYMVNHFFDNVYNILKSHNNIERDDNGNLKNTINGSLIFAYKNKAFTVDIDGFITEIEDYLVIGSGKEIAIGSLETSKDKKPEDRIKIAIKSCAENTLYVSDKIDIFYTIE